MSVAGALHAAGASPDAVRPEAKKQFPGLRVSPTAKAWNEARRQRVADEMEPMGEIAAGLMDPPDDGGEFLPVSQNPSAIGPRLTTANGGPDLQIIPQPANGTQAETSIAMNGTGNTLVVGYNDSRGFSTTPVSLSGLVVSQDGGGTWSSVPVGPGGASTLPSVTGGSVYGDPDVKYDPTRDNFVYTSIYVRPSDGLQGMCLHRSNANATTWAGPFEITPTFITGSSADKPFIDVNRVTGRILLGWVSFGTTNSTLFTTYSDDDGTTWSPAVTLVVSTATTFFQAPEPRFLPGTTNANSTAYIAWRNGDTTTFPGIRNIAMSRSTDGGATFSAPVNIDSVNYPAEDQILGVDRVNTSPSMAIDYTSGRVFVVYQRNRTDGEGDVAIRIFTGAPAPGTPLVLDPAPGGDRAQFNPCVTVDQTTHRVHVLWYDQGVKATGDIVEILHAYSDDGGVTWSPPTPVSDRPFHAGFGNDTGQPNLGDYFQAWAQGGLLHTVWAGTPVQVNFNEGQPNATTDAPDVYYDRTPDSARVAPLRAAATSLVEGCTAGANGQPDPGEYLDLTAPVTNYVTNSLSAATLTGLSGTLVTTTAGVTVWSGAVAYANAAPGATVSGVEPFRISLDSSVVPGTYLDFVLHVAAAGGAQIDLPLRLTSGTAGAPTLLINETFSAGTLAGAGWSSVTGGGSGTAWTVSQALTPGNNAAYHNEGTAISFVRLFSPIVAIPNPGSGYVTLDFDLTYDLEEEPAQSVLAYDGLTLRVTDQTSGATLRSVLAEAFAESITTGANNHFPRHLPRNNSAAYFQDMSVWSGKSPGTVHISMKFPGAGMLGRTVQLRFEYTQDSSGVCNTVDASRGPCGVAIDNVVLKMVPVVSAACTPGPLPPFGMNAPGTCGAVSLGWQTDNEPVVTGYSVLRGPDCGTLSALGTTTGTSYLDATATPGATYAYAVQSTGPAGASANGRCLTLTVGTPPPALGNSLTLAKAGADLGLSWSAPAGATQYRAYATSDPAGNAWPDPNPGNQPPAGWNSLGNSGTPSFTHTGAGADATNYFYHVTPGDAQGCYNNSQPLTN